MNYIKYYSINDVNRQIEIKFSKNNVNSFKPHSHEKVSIGYVKNGESILKVGEEFFNVKSNSLIFIPSDVIHRCKPKDVKNWEFIMVYLDKEYLLNFINKETMNKFHYMLLNLNEIIKIQNFFDKIKNDKNFIFIENDLKTIILDKFKSIDNIIDINIYCEEYLAKIIKFYIDSNLDKNIALEDLCEISNLSKGYLIKLFEKNYGIQPHKYLRMKRTFAAKDRLIIEKNISEIALEYQFSDQSHFTRYFKEYFGITPMKFVKINEK